MVETAMGKLASGDAHAARSSLFFLACAQNEDGGWSQNMWLDGTPHWTAIQMDAIALPILLADKMRREHAFIGYDPTDHGARGHQVPAAPWPLHRAGTLGDHAPATRRTPWPPKLPLCSPPQISPSSMAGTITQSSSAQPPTPGTTRSTNSRTSKEHRWPSATACAATTCGMTPPQRIQARDVGHLRILMPNVRSGPPTRRAIDIISPGFLALVRFGLRPPDDPRIVDTVKLLDATLRCEMTTGPGWRRSTDDGYGEHADGSPFDKRGIGRCWPLLAGERGHYELAAGRRDVALDLLKTMARQTSECGMIPEQVWDAADIPERFLFNGRPTGSSMPLAWAHSEYIKLLRSLHDNAIWDRTPQTRAALSSRAAHRELPDLDAGTAPRLAHPPERTSASICLFPHACAGAPGDRAAPPRRLDRGLGLHCAMIPTRELSPGATVRSRARAAEQAGRRHEDSGGRFVVRVKA